MISEIISVEEAESMGEGSIGLMPTFSVEGKIQPAVLIKVNKKFYAVKATPIEIQEPKKEEDG